MAVSDMIIYRTRAERLHSDLFQFLGNASVAFRRHFSSELRAAAQRFQSDDIDVSSLCPAVVIFHETQHTEPLPEGKHYQVQAVTFLKTKSFTILFFNLNRFTCDK